MSIEIVCCARLGDRALAHHLVPLANHPRVSKVWIVRHAPMDGIDIPKSEYVIVPNRNRGARFLRMIQACRRLTEREEVRAFVSFNPIPYGIFAMWAAGKSGKPVHFGFVGSDWNLRVKTWWGKFLLRYARRAALTTCTGQSMREEMIQSGLPAERIVVLPHTLNLAEYPLNRPETARYDSIFVGRLIALKQVDVILRAWSVVASDHPETRFAVVGSGPLRKQLEQLAFELKLGHRVDFTGQLDDVRPYYNDARTIVIASTHEGFPFVIVEAMASGVVPISTPVGTIEDVIRHRHNGMLFPVGDSEALAAAIGSVLDDPEAYAALRDNVIADREQYSHERATAIWSQWLSGL